MNNYNRIKAVLVEKEQTNKLLANTLHKEQQQYQNGTPTVLRQT